MNNIISLGATIHVNAKGRHTLFVTACEALWGDDFTAAAANALSINPRTIKRFKTGELDVQPRLLAELSTHLVDEQERLGNLAEMLRTVGAQS